MIFTRKSSKEKRVTCEDVVRAYGAVLEETPLGAGGSIDENVLPFDRQLIKEALVTHAFIASDMKQDSTMNMLQAGFLQLACFVKDRGKPSPIWNARNPLPKTREEISLFFQEYGPVANEEKAVSEKIDQETKRLAREWSLRWNCMLQVYQKGPAA